MNQPNQLNRDIQPSSPTSYNYYQNSPQSGSVSYPPQGNLPISPNPDGYNMPAKKNRRLGWILALVVVLMLVIGGGIYQFKDSFLGTSLSVGVKQKWTLELPDNGAKRYVEKLDDNTLILVTKLNGSPISVQKIKLSDRQKPKPSDISQPIADLPNCSTNSERPYTVKQGKIICNTKKMHTVSTASIKELTITQKTNLGKNLNVAVETETGMVAYTGKDAVDAYVVGLDKEKKLNWIKHYKGNNIEVSGKGDKLWVTTDHTLEELVPTANVEMNKETATISKQLNQVAEKEYCLPKLDICLNYPANYRIQEHIMNPKDPTEVTTYIVNPAGEKLVVARLTIGGFGISCIDEGWIDVTHKVLKVSDSQLVGLPADDYYQSDAKVITKVISYHGRYSIRQYLTQVKEDLRVGNHMVKDCLEPQWAWDFPQTIDEPNFFNYGFSAAIFGDQRHPIIFDSKEAVDKALKRPEVKIIDKILQSVHVKKSSGKDIDGIG